MIFNHIPRTKSQIYIRKSLKYYILPNIYSVYQRIAVSGRTYSCSTSSLRKLDLGLLGSSYQALKAIEGGNADDSIRKDWKSQ